MALALRHRDDPGSGPETLPGMKVREERSAAGLLGRRLRVR